MNLLWYSILFQIVITISMIQSYADVKEHEHEHMPDRKAYRNPFIKEKFIDNDDIYDIDADLTLLSYAVRNYEKPPRFQVNLIMDTRESSSVRKIALPVNKDDLLFIKENLNVEKTIAFLIPGYLSRGVTKWMRKLSSAYRQRSDCILFNVDWSSASLTSNYSFAVEHTHLVAKELISFIDVLIDELDVKASHIHLIGHSLGAHLAGFVGKGISGINRITGLDPAGPDFLKKSSMLSKGDAKHVDVVHTNSVFGNYDQLGDIDLYVNGGETQPGCFPTWSHHTIDLWVSANNIYTKKFKISTDMHHMFYKASENLCHHYRSVVYFIESLNNSKCKFVASSSMERAEKVSSNDFDPKQNTLLGLDVFKYQNSGKFYIVTNDEPHYCRS